MLRSGLDQRILRRFLCGAVVAVLVLITNGSSVFAQKGGAFPQFLWGGAYKATQLEGMAFNDSLGSLLNPAAQRGCQNAHISLEQIVPAGVPITALAWTSGPNWGGHLLVRQTPAGLGFDYNTYQLGFTYSAKLTNFTLGASPKLLAVSISGTETGFDDTAFGFGMDLGLGYDLEIDFASFTQFSLDFSGTDLLSSVRYGSGTVERAAPAIYRATASLKGERITLGAVGRFSSGSSSYRVGGEYRFFSGKERYADILENIAIRAGASKKQLSFGIGIKLKGFGVDYAYRLGDEIAESDRVHSVSVSWHF